MEFLEKLYSQEYFAPILFVVIAILAVLFVIVLILALRDAKKNKEVVDKTEDTFAKVDDEPQEISLSINKDTEPEKNEETVINNVEPVNNSFENIQISEPTVEVSEKQIVTEVKEEENSIPIAPVDSQDIKLESSPVATHEEVEKAENDLDTIAATLLSEYQKGNAEDKNQNVDTKEQFSSVYVTPNTLPNENENSNDLHNLNDIPAPQPVRVTETSTVIDSSKSNVDNIEVEEYSINR